jgi:hypothetical protein
MPGRAARKTARKTAEKANSGATVGYEAQLWQMADMLRGFDRYPDLKADFMLAFGA